MNKERRKAIELAGRRLVELEERVGALLSEMEDIIADIEFLRDEEQESFDNLPESLQGSARGQAMEEVVDHLDVAMGSIMELKDALDESLIDDSRDSLSAAMA